MSRVSKEHKKRIDLLNGCEVCSIKYETCVGIEGNKVIDAGEVVDTLNTNKKIDEIFNEYFKQNF